MPAWTGLYRKCALCCVLAVGWRRARRGEARRTDTHTPSLSRSGPALSHAVCHELEGRREKAQSIEGERERGRERRGRENPHLRKPRWGPQRGSLSLSSGTIPPSSHHPHHHDHHPYHRHLPRHFPHPPHHQPQVTTSEKQSPIMRQHFDDAKDTELVILIRTDDFVQKLEPFEETCAFKRRAFTLGTGTFALGRNARSLANR